MEKSAHLDPFAAQNLPPPADQPDFCFTLPQLTYPSRLNAVAHLLDRHIALGNGARTALLAPGLCWSYAELHEKVNRIAQVLVREAGFVPGNRVLLRSANSPMLVAAYLAILKAGGIVVATMPLLRAKELVYPIEKARISLALCDARLLSELQAAASQAPVLTRIIAWGDGGPENGRPESLEAMMARMPGAFEPVDTSAEDICLIGFTSGTTGPPKGTMHHHRDLLAICDCYGAQVLRPRQSDIFIGSPPLAFTFGLGGLVLFPLSVGAASVLLERAGPDELLPAIARFGATIVFTAPTAYRAMLGGLQMAVPQLDISSLRACVSAGEALPKATFEAWRAATGLSLMDGIGATEMLHIFIASPLHAIRPGATGQVVPGYEARILDETGKEAPRGTIGRLAVRGPTGCRYLADPRQRDYVQGGWNLTGDSYIQDQDGYFWFQARSDDMIVSAGYNISGPEVEASLLAHPDIAECGVVGAPDPERGMRVKAYCVLRSGLEPSPARIEALQAHVKADIAPYKYPREIVFVAALPRTQTGKLQRFALREWARREAQASPIGNEASGA